MQKMTSAYANKMIRSLEEDKLYWEKLEADSCAYVAAINEEPVIPEFDFAEVAATLARLDEKIAIIKHAVNLANATAQVSVGEDVLSVDMILVKMAQLNRRKNVLDNLRKMLPKTREDRGFASRNVVPEYRYINFDPEVVKQEYERISALIMEMQMALDKHNQTVTFDVDI